MEVRALLPGHCTTVRFVYGEYEAGPADSRHVSLTRVLDPQARDAVVLEARKIQTMAEVTRGSDRRPYTWQAKDWAAAARCHLGDLDSDEASAWIQTQLFLTGADNKVSDNECLTPSNCWWLLMVAFR